MLNSSFKLCKGKSHVYLSDSIRENKTSISLLDGNKKVIMARQNLLYRYVRYNYLESDINNGSLTFVSPTCWDDPCDYLLYADPSIKINGKSDLDIACLCTSYKSIKNEEATWRLYGMDYVRIALSIFKLIDILENVAINATPNLLSFYITVIDYSKGKTGIKKIHDNINNSYSTLEECLSYLSLKRMAFEYEQEVRIFAVGKGLYTGSKQIFMAKGIEYTKELVHSIYLPPLHPIKYDSPRHEYYNNIQNALNKGIKDQLNSIIPGCNISQSGLYKL